MGWITTRPTRDGIYWWREHGEAEARAVAIRDGGVYLLVPAPSLFETAHPGEWCKDPIQPPKDCVSAEELDRNIAILTEALISKSPALNEWAVALLKRIELRFDADERRELAALERQAAMVRANGSAR